MVKQTRFRLSFGAVAVSAFLAWCLGSQDVAMGRNYSRAAAPTQEDFEDYLVQDQGVATAEQLERADAINQKTIKSIEELLQQKNVPEHRKFELYLRLGELYSERHDYLRDVEVITFDKAYDEWAKNKKGGEPKANHRRSKDEMLRAVGAFRRLVEQFPRHPRTDAALYSLAKTLARLNNENCTLYFGQLVKNYPQSTLIPDAHLAMGEFYFDRHNISKAMESYKNALEFKESKTYPYAVYKLGWAFRNAPAKSADDQKKNNDKALAAFKLVVKLHAAKQVTTKLNLRQEAINDLVLVWADTQDVEEAWDYFKGIGESRAFYDLLERLGGIYADQGKNSEAIKAYERLLREAPGRTSAPEIYSKLLSLHEKGNQDGAVVADLAAMDAAFVKDSVWTKANDDKAVRNDARKKTEQSMHRYGALFHSRGQKTSNDSLQKSASKIYAMYLTSFPESESSYEIRYYLAAILFHFQQWEAASEEYSKVALQKPETGKYLKDAALNAVVAITNLDASNKGQSLPPPGKVPSPIAIPRAKAKLVVVIDNYVKLLPADTEGHAMRFTAAQIHFDYGHYEEANRRFEAIANEIPQTKQGKSAVKVVLGYYNEQKKWDELISKSRRYSESKKLMQGLSDVILTNLKRGVYQKALAQEQAKQNKAAAETFLAFQAEFPKDENADRSLFNATVNYYRVGEVEKAIEASKKILVTYPTSKLVPDVMVDMGTSYEAMAQFEEAATMYRTFAEKFEKDSRASGALYNAALLFKGLGNEEMAITLFQNFAKRFSSSPVVVDALIERASLLERRKNYPAAVAAFEEVARRAGGKDAKVPVDRLFLARAKAMELKYFHTNRKDGESDIARLRRELISKNAPNAAEARRIIAKTLFKRSEEDFLKFKAITVAGARSLEKEAGLKQGRLVNLAARYEEVIDLKNGEYTVASLYRLGEIHENFATDLLASQPPQGSNQKDIDAYRSAIEKAAFPLREQATKFFETAYQRSREVETFTTWTKLAYQKMGEINPKKFPVIAEQGAEATYMAHKMTWEPAVASLGE